MDPITAVCTLANTLASIVLKVLDGQPKEVQAELWKLYLQDVKDWRAFWAGLGIGHKEPK